MEEFLVSLACLTSKGCSETSSAYYKTHPELREMIEYNEKKVKDYVGPVVVESMGPMVFFVAGGTGNFNLGYGFSLKIKQYQDTMLVFNKGF